MVFILLLLSITLAIASTAAFFSVWGLAEVFSGSFVAVIIMGTVLEAGKLISASFLYRYWTTITMLMRGYLIAAIVVLMFVTSIGIFGKLSYSYQQDIHTLSSVKSEIGIITDQREELKQLKIENLERKRQIDADIAGLPSDYVTGRQRLMESYGVELNGIQANITSFNSQIRSKSGELDELKKRELQESLHVGPIIYIAKAFGRNTDDATKWLIFMIIFAFDPLAIILTVGTNIALIEHRKQKSNSGAMPPMPDSSVVTEFTDGNNQVPSTMSNQDIKQALRDIQEATNNRELTPAEMAQKAAFEEILNKKALTNMMRNPSGKS